MRNHTPPYSPASEKTVETVLAPQPLEISRDPQKWIAAIAARTVQLQRKQRVSEDKAVARTRRFFSHMPSSIYRLFSRGPTTDEPSHSDETLLSAVPTIALQVCKIRAVLETAMGRGPWFETGEWWGRSVVSGLARLDGWPVAVLASDPYHFGGAWTGKSSEKVTRFVDFAETFDLPVVRLADIPGFNTGVDTEEAATIRYGVRAMAAIYQATVPWCTILIRRAFGVASAAHQPTGRFCVRCAWPSWEWGSLPIAGGHERAYKAGLEQAKERAAKLAEIEARLSKLTSPFRTAGAFLIEEIIDPRKTRLMLCGFARLAASLRTAPRSIFCARPKIAVRYQ